MSRISSLHEKIAGGLLQGSPRATDGQTPWHEQCRALKNVESEPMMPASALSSHFEPNQQQQSMSTAKSVNL